jgi:hypothetical protein
LPGVHHAVREAHAPVWHNLCLWALFNVCAHRPTCHAALQRGPGLDTLKFSIFPCNEFLIFLALEWGQ